MIDIISRAEAISLGLTRYFTGMPCPNGHVAPRIVSNGSCHVCSLEKGKRKYAVKRDDPQFRKANAVRSLANYNAKMAGQHEVRQTKLDAQIAAAKLQFPDAKIRTRKEAIAEGASTYFVGAKCPKGHIAERRVSGCRCVECAAIQTANWIVNNPEWSVAYEKNRYAENPDFFRAKTRKYHAERANDPEYRQVSSERARKWAKANPVKHKAAMVRRRGRELQAEGVVTADDISRIRAAQKDRCAYCRKKLKGMGELDHIHPLAPRNGGKPGTNHPSNLQFLCMPCNRRKHTKDPIEFARASGFLL